MNRTLPMKLSYGKNHMEAPDLIGDFAFLGHSTADLPGLTDIEIGARLDEPLGSACLEDLVEPGDRVLLVVPDGTRNAGAGSVANLLVRRLIASGIEPYNMAAIFANGIHRPVTEDERKEILTPFLAQRLKSYNHEAIDLMRKAGLESSRFTLKGTTRSGIDVWLNRVLDEYDKVVTIGSVGFHYFAGFSGGRKMICPGLAAAETISETHRLAFDFENGTRASGVATGRLDGNPVHEAFIECAAMAPPIFSVNTIVNRKGEIEDLICGDWIASHEEACKIYGERKTLHISEKRDVVVVSCGGHPFDLNLIQAHKSLESASKACNDDGVIVLLAECLDGFGREDFMKWFELESAEGIAESLRNNYEVNGQTAWSLRVKTERFEVRMVTSLDEASVQQMGMTHYRDLETATSDLKGKSGYLIEAGHETLIETN